MNQQQNSTETARERAALDAYLDAASKPQASADLKRRIMASYAASGIAPQSNAVSGWVQKIFPGVQVSAAGMRASLSASVAAGVGVLGLMTGMLTATTQAAYPPEYEAYAYLEQTSLELEEERAIWDED
ncbi:MAG: hypothetical protein DHS20C05_17250 [Hyphococcus sp.]|nr:MAG: hypothetical protein DHS20C05_17250 [Marinicaulis sp.]